MTTPTKRFLGIMGGLVLVLLLLALRNRSKPAPATDLHSPAADPGNHRTQNGSSTQRVTPLGFKTPSTAPSSIAPYLLLAQEMAFDSRYARSGLTNLLIMLSLSDSFTSPEELSDEQLITHLSDQGLPAELIRERLVNYPRGNTTVTALYTRNESIPGFKEVRAALTRSGQDFDPSSECLLDCLRFVASSDEMTDFLHGLQKSMSDGPGKDIYAPLVETLARDEQDLRWAFTRVFRDRFQLRYGLSEPQVDALMESLAGLTVHTATTQDLYLPRRRRD
jgi:hypothetical protein